MAIKIAGTNRPIVTRGVGKMRYKKAGVVVDARPYSRLSAYANPIIAGHRGGVWPEEAYETYQQNLTEFAGKPILLDADFQVLSNGRLGLMHDDTVDRTTDGVGSMDTYTEASLKALRVDTFDQFNADYANFHPCTGDEFFRDFVPYIPALVEPKDSAGAALLLARIKALGLQRSVFVNAFGQYSLTPFAAEGMPTMMHSPETSGLTPQQIKDLGITHINWRATSLPADVAPYTAVGLRIWSGADRRFDWAPWRTTPAANHEGGISGDPLWMHGSAPLRTVDNFATRRFNPGHIPYTPGYPGSFYDLGGGVWGWAPEPDALGWTCWGWLNVPRSAVPNSLWNYSTGAFGSKAAQYPFGVEFDATYLSAGATPTRRVGIAIGSLNDGPFNEPLTGATQGYGGVFTLAPDGTMEMHLKTQSATRGGGGSVASTPIAVGQKVRLRCEKTTNSVYRMTRLDTGVTFTTAAVSGSSGYIGGYVHAGLPGAAGSTGRWAFSNVVAI